MWQRLNKKAFAYATTVFAASMMNSVFFFYYVKVFLRRYHVSEAWFQFSQVIFFIQFGELVSHAVQICFMVWNAVNDPLFGYLQDKKNFSITRTRRHSILFGAPLYGLAFLVPWFQWGSGR